MLHPSTCILLLLWPWLRVWESIFDSGVVLIGNLDTFLIQLSYTYITNVNLVRIITWCKLILRMCRIFGLIIHICIYVCIRTYGLHWLGSPLNTALYVLTRIHLTRETYKNNRHLWRKQRQSLYRNTCSNILWDALWNLNKHQMKQNIKSDNRYMVPVLDRLTTLPALTYEKGKNISEIRRKIHHAKEVISVGTKFKLRSHSFWSLELFNNDDQAE